MTPVVMKTATLQTAFAQASFFYSSAREGMLDLLARGAIGAGGVLLPAYIGWSAREGSGVFDPVRQSGAEYGFYGLNPDLSVEIDSLEHMLAQARPAVLILIHYFGRTEPNLARIRELADEYRVVLVEDLAHGFFTAQQNGPAGRSGDVLLYSLHKMFPIPDGGQVVYRDRSLVSAQADTRAELARTVLNFDWAAIARQRRDNFTALTTELSRLVQSGSPFRLLWSELSPHDVPQTLPVYVLGGVRDQLYGRMNDLGYGMVSLYHTLIPEVGASFPVTDDLAKHIINFPVHQDVTSESIVPMAQAFGALLDELDTASGR